MSKVGHLPHYVMIKLGHHDIVRLMPDLGHLLMDLKSTSHRHMTCTGGCNHSFMYSWWWVQRAPETRGV